MRTPHSQLHFYATDQIIVSVSERVSDSHLHAESRSARSASLLSRFLPLSDAQREKKPRAGVVLAVIFASRSNRSAESL